MSSTIAAFIGAIIGAAASLFGLLIQQWFQNKRVRNAADLAMNEYQHDLDLAKSAGGGHVAPISAYVMYHAK
jgi:hypothetical protein